MCYLDVLLEEKQKWWKCQWWWEEGTEGQEKSYQVMGWQLGFLSCHLSGRILEGSAPLEGYRPSEIRKTGTDWLLGFIDKPIRFGLRSAPSGKDHSESWLFHRIESTVRTNWIQYHIEDRTASYCISKIVQVSNEFVSSDSSSSSSSKE